MSDMGNICKFSGANENYQDIFAFQFIYETAPTHLDSTRSYAAFVCHLVTEGTAVFRVGANEWPLKQGDIFFAFPSLNFTLEPSENFKYLYISFIGSYATELLEDIGISRQAPVYNMQDHLADIWFRALEHCTSDNLSFMAKGVLFYTFAFIQQKPPEKKHVADSCDDVVTRMRELIERDYGNSDLSLDYLCSIHRYNSKYISRRFREIVGISFSEYLINCRIRHACVLLLETDLSIREISAMVGYKEALYFSKVFKKHIGATPGNYRLNQAEK